MQNAECRMQNAECRMQNSECRMQNAVTIAIVIRINIFWVVGIEYLTFVGAGDGFWK